MPKPCRSIEDAIDKINREALTTTEAAARAGVSNNTMHKWMKTGVVKAFRVGDSVRIWPEDLPAAVVR